tara:strand:+ start:2512 stop:2826 length:315 start_codon:yes stop_codon:yes gene_type:complete
MKFLKFLMIWISQQLAVPFWLVGHIHLSLSLDLYSDVKILFASLGMNAVVAVGFWLDWKIFSKVKVDHTSVMMKEINGNRKTITETSNMLSRVLDEIKQMKVYK